MPLTWQPSSPRVRSSLVVERQYARASRTESSRLRKQRIPITARFCCTLSSQHPGRIATSGKAEARSLCRKCPRPGRAFEENETDGKALPGHTRTSKDVLGEAESAAVCARDVLR